MKKPVSGKKAPACFRRKEQFDMAMQQLEAAAREITRMDGLKKDILYTMGEIAESNGDREAASDYFKQIYQVDIKYRDVAEKIEKIYARP